MGFRFTDGGPTHRALTGSDVALFMVALKASRLAWMPEHEDSWTDLAGYAACGFETATLEAERRQPVGETVTVPDGEPVTLAPKGAISNAIREAAETAAFGDPASLEAKGYFLTESTLPCFPNVCDSGHTFKDACRFRICKRRTDVTG
jgi:hypothetical protein